MFRPLAETPCFSKKLTCWTPTLCKERILNACWEICCWWHLPDMQCWNGILQRNLLGTSNSGVPLGIPSLKAWIFLCILWLRVSTTQQWLSDASVRVIVLSTPKVRWNRICWLPKNGKNNTPRNGCVSTVWSLLRTDFVVFPFEPSTL